MLALIVLRPLVDGFLRWPFDDPEDDAMLAALREVVRRRDAGDRGPVAFSSRQGVRPESSPSHDHADGPPEALG
jgi:hypothetical protein